MVAATLQLLQQWPLRAKAGAVVWRRAVCCWPEGQGRWADGQSLIQAAGLINESKADRSEAYPFAIVLRYERPVLFALGGILGNECGALANSVMNTCNIAQL